MANRKVTLLMPLLAAITILMVANLPFAAYSASISREISVFAQASWVTEDSEGRALNTLLFVRESTGTPDSESELTVVRDIVLDGEIVTQSGSIFTQADLFSMDDLNTATLSPTDIVVCIPFSNICETLTLQARWTGLGDVEKSTSKFFSKEDDMRFKIKESTRVSEAVATGSIGAQDLGESENAQLRTTELVVSMKQ
jgi:hypothetical protein